MYVLRALSLFMTLGVVLAAQASDPLHYDLINLHAEVQGEVINDLMIAELVVEREHRDSATLANLVNADMQWALTQLKRYPSVEAGTRNYQTWPRYESKNNRIIGWYATQTLHIESEDFAAAREALQTLQEKLLVRSMQLQPKPATRTAEEDELIAAALNRFKARALIVQLNMGAADYRIVNLSINTSRHSVPMNYRAADMSRSAEVEQAPAIEGGASKLSVSVQGQIQLQ